jgi:hypothetical protein
MSKTQNLKTETAKHLPLTSETLAQLDADISALAAEARELSDDFRVGDDLRFKKGEWSKVVDDHKRNIGSTATFVVDMLSYKRGWIKWVDRRPVFKAIGRPVDGFVSPTRDRLGDNDKNGWPRDAKGEPQDPWQEHFSIVMRDLSDDRLCTWTTTGYYGPKALGKLLDEYVRKQKQHPGLYPVALLLSETKPSTNFGDVEAPLLKIVDWKPFGEGAAPPGLRNLPPPPLPQAQQVLPPPKPSKPSLGDDIDDESPFSVRAVSPPRSAAKWSDRTRSFVPVPDIRRATARWRSGSTRARRTDF